MTSLSIARQVKLGHIRFSMIFKIGETLPG